MALVYGPIIETLIFNMFLNEIICKFLNKYATIIISSLVFAAIHFYSLYYVFFAFIGGVVLNTLYFYCKINWSMYLAFFVTWLLHFNHNLIGIILNK
ncbi:CPBP family glutamic-type intramembrane protease [Aurantibacter crassamenti]|uniref:CPBP family glutamic-type intramembrane protease n=1 Tax=Aurantibacter crassamenti TaxID=1837375 RepID=UPI003742169D